MTWRKIDTRGNSRGKPPSLGRFIEELSWWISCVTNPLYKQRNKTQGAKSLVTEVNNVVENSNELFNKRQSSGEHPRGRQPLVPCGVHGPSSRHSIEKCDAFARLSTNERIDKIIAANLCFRCLKPGHALPSCPRSFKCRYCQRSNHNALICYEAPGPPAHHPSWRPNNRPRAMENNIDNSPHRIPQLLAQDNWEPDRPQ